MGRTPIGAGQGLSPLLSMRTLGERIGAETHQLSVAELPSHQHESPYPTNAGSSGSDNFTEPFGYGRTASQTGQNVELYNMHPDAAAEGNEVHPYVSATGSGAAHNNMQPSLAINFIIKT